MQKEQSYGQPRLAWTVWVVRYRLPARISRRGQGTYKFVVLRYRSAVYLFQPAAEKIVEEPGHDRLRLADDHCIRMGKSLFGHNGRVHPSHDDRNPFPPELIGNFIGPCRLVRHGSDSDEVELSAGWDRILAFIDEGHLPVGRSHCGNLLERQGRELEIFDPAELMRRRVNEKEPGRYLLLVLGGYKP